MCNHPSIDYYRRTGDYSSRWTICERERFPCLNGHDAPPSPPTLPSNRARNTKTDHERTSLPRYVAAVKVKSIVKLNGLMIRLVRFSCKVRLYFDFPFAFVQIFLIIFLIIAALDCSFSFVEIWFLFESFFNFLMKCIMILILLFFGISEKSNKELIY